MSDVLIECENVGKKFCRDLKKSLWYGVKDSFSEVFGATKVRHQLRHGEFWANHEIGFTLKRGECLGLVGRNGAGKTTLLKLLSGLIKPDVGRIRLEGRIGAMIALGAGFNPILTARENIYVNGAILGMGRKQVNDRFDEIVEFSELGEFIDTPVRSFSSGMQVRLGFAVAVILIKPDILLLDEVLAVGDAGFRSKCYNSVMELTTTSAVILVSHTMPQIARVSTQVAVMQKGRMASHSHEAATGIQAYYDLFPVNSESIVQGEKARINTLSAGAEGATSPGGCLTISRQATAKISATINLRESVNSALCIFTFLDREQRSVCRSDCKIGYVSSGERKIVFEFEGFPLVPGKYDLHVMLCDAQNPQKPLHLVRYDPFCQVMVTSSHLLDHTITCSVFVPSAGTVVA